MSDITAKKKERGEEQQSFDVTLLSFFGGWNAEPVLFRDLSYDEWRGLRALRAAHTLLFEYCTDFVLIGELTEEPHLCTVKQYADALYPLCSPHLTEKDGYLAQLEKVIQLVKMYPLSDGRYTSPYSHSPIPFYFVTGQPEYRAPFVLLLYVLLVGFLDPRKGTYAFAMSLLDEAKWNYQRNVSYWESGRRRSGKGEEDSVMRSRDLFQEAWYFVRGQLREAEMEALRYALPAIKKNTNDGEGKGEKE